MADMTGMLQQIMAQRMQQGMGQGDQQQAQLTKLQQQAERAPAVDEAERYGAMARAAAQVPPMVGGFGAMLANIGGAYGETLAKQEQAKFEREAMIAKLMQQDDSNLYKLMAVGNRTVGGKTGGPMFTLPDGTPVYKTGTELFTVGPEGERNVWRPSDKSILGADVKAKLVEDELKAWVESRQWPANMPAEEEDRIISAQRAKIAGKYGSGTPSVATPAAQQPAPTLSDAITPPEASVELAPGTDKSKVMQQLERDIKEAGAMGDFSRGLELQKMLKIMKAEQGAAPVAAQPAPLPGLPQRKDKIAEEGKKTTSVEAAKIYAKRFDEDVVTPAAAFADTSKIMQDFNNLGQMQAALKNGKLKEFMAGETGKWLMPLLPEGSQLRKGIANAQEAEKLTASMVNRILLAAKGVQTEGDAQRARSQVTSIGTDPDANKYLEAYITETSRQLKQREQMGLDHEANTGTFRGYDKVWQNSPIMKAKGSVKKIGTQWIGVSQYMGKLREKYPNLSDEDAVASWNKVK